jgi:hypothetical protein
MNEVTSNDRNATRPAIGPLESQPTRMSPNAKQELDRRLDLALEETFPASDPISIMIW